MKDELDLEYTEFARRTRVLLEHSVHELPARIRSRLTRARYAALEIHADPERIRGGLKHAPWRRWLPAGAAAAAVFVVLLIQAPRPGSELLRARSGGSEDLELLADSSALALAQDQLSQAADLEYEFYDWAVTTAQDERTGEAGS